MKLITDFASSALRFDPNTLLEQLSAYPTRTRGDPIEWGACQWVDGTHSALNGQEEREQRASCLERNVQIGTGAVSAAEAARRMREPARQLREPARRMREATADE